MRKCLAQCCRFGVEASLSDDSQIRSCCRARREEKSSGGPAKRDRVGNKSRQDDIVCILERPKPSKAWREEGCQPEREGAIDDDAVDCSGKQRRHCFDGDIIDDGLVRDSRSWSCRIVCRCLGAQEPEWKGECDNVNGEVRERRGRRNVVEGVKEEVIRAVRQDGERGQIKV